MFVPKHVLMLFSQWSVIIISIYRWGTKTYMIESIFRRSHSMATPFRSNFLFNWRAIELELPLEQFRWWRRIEQPVSRAVGWPDRMSHRKWRETKMQPSRARPGHQISCCLVALYFLCDILLDRPVDGQRWLECGFMFTVWNLFAISVDCTEIG